MKKRSKRRVEDAEGDMMPMVDVIFLLIIFFVLITEITQAELEEMVLPEADMANPDTAPPPGRLVINIVKADEDDPDDRSGEIVISRTRYDIGSDELIELLRERADEDPHTGEALRESREDLSDLQVLIRCDRRVKYQYFQRLMAMMSHPDKQIGIWQVQIAIAEKDTQ